MTATCVVRCEREAFRVHLLLDADYAPASGRHEARACQERPIGKFGPVARQAELAFTSEGRRTAYSRSLPTPNDRSARIKAVGGPDRATDRA
jgi:hypothetical protein